jgi:predicted negative regulator of RcsB-dependent stress response
MDEDVSIINTNTRNEKIKNFFVNNKNKLIFGIIIILVGIVAVYGFDKYQTNKKQQISDNYNLITIEYSENNKEKTTNKLIEIVNAKDPTYSPLSLYFIIDNKLLSDQKKINELFDILINQTPLDDEINNLIIYKKALFNADQYAEGDMLNILNPLINSKSVWKSHALYLMAEYFYAKEQNQKAKEFFKNNQFRKPESRYKVTSREKIE